MGPDTTLTTFMAPSPQPRRQLAQHPLAQALRRLPDGTRWALGGLLLALAMVAVFYLILANSVARAELKRTTAQSEAQHRHRCAMIDVRLMRDQCFARLSTGQPMGEND